MNHDDHTPVQPPYQDQLSEKVGRKEKRKLKARQQDRSIWYGLGMFGLVGWSIAVPTLIGIAIGIWMDRTWQHGFSCTLICMFLGIAAGCSIAWYWVKREILDFADSEDDESSNDVDNKVKRSRET